MGCFLSACVYFILGYENTAHSASRPPLRVRGHFLLKASRLGEPEPPSRVLTALVSITPLSRSQRKEPEGLSSAVTLRRRAAWSLARPQAHVHGQSRGRQPCVSRAAKPAAHAHASASRGPGRHPPAAPTNTGDNQMCTGHIVSVAKRTDRVVARSLPPTPGAPFLRLWGLCM